MVPAHAGWGASKAGGACYSDDGDYDEDYDEEEDDDDDDVYTERERSLLRSVLGPPGAGAAAAPLAPLAAVQPPSLPPLPAAMPPAASTQDVTTATTPAGPSDLALVPATAATAASVPAPTGAAATERALKLNLELQRLCASQLHAIEAAIERNERARRTAPAEYKALMSPLYNAAAGRARQQQRRQQQQQQPQQQLARASASVGDLNGPTRRRVSDASAFGDSLGNPAPNADALARAALREALPLGGDLPPNIPTPRYWNEADRDALRMGVTRKIAEAEITRLRSANPLANSAERRGIDTLEQGVAEGWLPDAKLKVRLE